MRLCQWTGRETVPSPYRHTNDISDIEDPCELRAPVSEARPGRGRIQGIWRTPEYGGHMGHIHIGARRGEGGAQT